MLNDVQLITIEGGIGVGKSTVLEALHAAYPEICILEEPVTKWEVTGLLDAMYNGSINPGTFQIAALSTRMGPLLAAVRRGCRVIVSERCPYSDYRVFTRANLKEGSVEMKAYEMAYHSLIEAMSPTSVHIIYLHAEVEVLEQRMKARGRAAEQVEGTQRKASRHQYLQRLHGFHEEFYNWPSAQSRTRVDATQKPAVVAEAVKAALRGLLESGQTGVTASD